MGGRLHSGNECLGGLADHLHHLGMVQVTEKEKAIEAEIKEHKEWCSPTCQTFLPSEYREARQTRTKEQCQRDYDLVHIWR